MEYDVQVSMYYKREEIGFTVDKPNGAYHFIFIHFINPVNIRLYNQMITTMPHACIIFPPNEPYYYKADDFELLHNWAVFLPMEEKYNPQNLGLPVNKIFYTDIGPKITKTIEAMNWLKYAERFESVSNELLKLFLMLSEERKLYKKNLLYDNHKEKFNELRLLIYENPKSWNISNMASYVNLSRSRFSVKYKSIFSVSPIDDLSNATICLAKKLLSTTSLTCQNIATECGYKSTPFFIQKFKTLVGCTPNEWRKDMNLN